MKKFGIFVCFILMTVGTMTVHAQDFSPIAILKHVDGSISFVYDGNDGIWVAETGLQYVQSIVSNGAMVAYTKTISPGKIFYAPLSGETPSAVQSISCENLGCFPSRVDSHSLEYRYNSQLGYSPSTTVNITVTHRVDLQTLEDSMVRATPIIYRITRIDEGMEQPPINQVYRPNSVDYAMYQFASDVTTRCYDDMIVAFGVMDEDTGQWTGEYTKDEYHFSGTEGCSTGFVWTSAGLFAGDRENKLLIQYRLGSSETYGPLQQPVMSIISTEAN